MKFLRLATAFVLLAGCERVVSPTPSRDSGLSQDVVPEVDSEVPADRAIPADAGLVALARRLSAGLSHVCVLRDGRVTCAGGIVAGAMGFDPEGRPRPVQVPGMVVSISSFQNSACALSQTGDVYCWGNNFLGLGAGVTEVAQPSVATLSEASFLSGAIGHCALRGDGAFCWGEVPVPGPTLADRPQRLDVEGDTVMLAAGFRFYCVLGADHRVRCRGVNDHGQSGRAPSPEAVPLTEVQGLQDAVEVRSGGAASCARRVSGRVACWGSNQFGTLGTRRERDQFVAANMPGLENVIQIAVSGANACAVTQDGAVWCWGTRQAGLMGDGVRVADDQSPDFVQSTPIRVPEVADAVETAVGTEVACALRRDQSVWCWGRNNHSSLPWPNGTVSRPVRVVAAP
ncbi:MAG: hypothetical protein IPF99_09630 [Deltaproteobacteria bacterium]|nr:hypothetical protein [Deltaproteobacteria bacterium]